MSLSSKLSLLLHLQCTTVYIRFSCNLSLSQAKKWQTIFFFFFTMFLQMCHCSPVETFYELYLQLLAYWTLFLGMLWKQVLFWDWILREWTVLQFFFQHFKLKILQAVSLKDSFLFLPFVPSKNVNRIFRLF